jgi:hypothetical protein
MWRHCSGVEVIAKTRSEQEIDRQLKVMQETADKLFSTPEKTKEFFVHHSFITPGGKLTKRYRSK